MRPIAAIIAAALTGCATAAPPPAAVQVITRTVQVPVAVRCRPHIAGAPDYPDTDAALRAAPDLFARVRLLVAGRLMRIARSAELEAAVDQCGG